jgi:hypothetical protein
MEKEKEQNTDTGSILTLKNTFIILGLCFSPLLLISTPILLITGITLGPISLVVWEILISGLPGVDQSHSSLKVQSF